MLGAGGWGEDGEGSVSERSIYREEGRKVTIFSLTQVVDDDDERERKRHLQCGRGKKNRKTSIGWVKLCFWVFYYYFYTLILKINFKK